MMRNIKRGKKGSIISDYLGWIILGVLVLIIFIGVVIIATGKGSGALAYIQDLFRFGRG